LDSVTHRGVVGYEGFSVSQPLVAGLVCSLVALAQGATIESETQTLATGAVVRDSIGVSGNQYVNSNGMTFTVTVDSTGIYDLSIKMWVKQYDWFNSSIFINKSTTAVASFLTNSPSLPFTSYTLATSAKLTAGSNTIAVTGGTANFDALTLVRQPPVVFQLDAAPVTPNATVSAQKLKTFLTRNFGTKTIAGMMIGDNAFNYDYGNMRLITKCVASDSCKVADSLTTFLGQEDIRLFKQRSGEHPPWAGSTSCSPRVATPTKVGSAATPTTTSAWPSSFGTWVAYPRSRGTGRWGRTRSSTSRIPDSRTPAAPMGSKGPRRTIPASTTPRPSPTATCSEPDILVRPVQGHGGRPRQDLQVGFLKSAGLGRGGDLAPGPRSRRRLVLVGHRWQHLLPVPLSPGLRPHGEASTACAT
jgi:hypothetical protein